MLCSKRWVFLILILTLTTMGRSQQPASCWSKALPSFRQKQYPEAERQLRSCLSANPEDAPAHELLGLVFADSGVQQSAAEQLRQALTLAAANDNYRFNLAMFLAQSDHIDAADEIAKPLLKSRPGADAFSLFGYIKLRQHQEREAADWFEKVVSEAPERSEAWYRLGFCRQSLGEFVPAIVAYRKVIALDSRNPRALLQLGKVLLLQGNYPGSESELEKSAGLDPSRASTWRYLSQSQLLAGKKEIARTSAVTAVTLGASDPRNHHQLGLALKGLGREADAEREFQTMERLRTEQRMPGKPAANDDDY